MLSLSSCHLAESLEQNNDVARYDVVGRCGMWNILIRVVSIVAERGESVYDVVGR